MKKKLGRPKKKAGELASPISVTLYPWQIEKLEGIVLSDRRVTNRSEALRKIIDEYDAG